MQLVYWKRPLHSVITNENQFIFEKLVTLDNLSFYEATLRLKLFILWNNKNGRLLLKSHARIIFRRPFPITNSEYIVTNTEREWIWCFYLVLLTFSLNGSNENVTLFTPFRLICSIFFIIAEKIPFDRVKDPLNFTDIFIYDCRAVFSIYTIDRCVVI